MYVDKNIVAEKVKQRQNRIDTYASTNKMPSCMAAIYIDGNAPLSTNKKMLAEAGYSITEVTLDNFRDVLHALQDINVTVIFDKKMEEELIVSKLNCVINEPVNECWGGPDMQEFVDLNG